MNHCQSWAPASLSPHIISPNIFQINWEPDLPGWDNHRGANTSTEGESSASIDFLKKDEECRPPSCWHCTSSSVTLCLVLKTNYWGAEICGALLQTKGFKTQWRSTGKSQSWGTTLTVLSRPPAPNTQKTTSFSVHAACYLNIYELSPPAVKKLLINYSSHKSWTKVPSNCQNAFKNPSVLNITV